MESKNDLCEACGENEATGHCQNEDYAGYALCSDCIAEYDSRPHGIIEAGKER